MSASVHVLRESKLTTEQLFSDALERARAGEFVDAIVITTDTDGDMAIGWAACNAGDLALASLLLADKAREKARS